MVPATSQSTNPAELRRMTLLRIRLVWGALIAGQVMFAVAVIVITQLTGGLNVEREVVTTLFYVTVALGAVMLPAGYVVRMQAYKAGWKADGVAPAQYFAGNLILLAMAEGVALFSLVVALLAGSLVPWALMALAALLVQTLNFPNGQAMFQPMDDLTQLGG